MKQPIFSSVILTSLLCTTTGFAASLPSWNLSNSFNQDVEMLPFYVGANVSGLFNSSTVLQSPFAGETARERNYSGGTIGLEAGVDYPISSQFIMGLSLNSTVGYFSGIILQDLKDNMSARLSNNILIMARARIGYRLNQSLFYGFGGLSYTYTTLEYRGNTNTPPQQQWDASYILGLGVEYAINKNWSLKTELTKMFSETAIDTPKLEHRVSTSPQIVTLGFLYRY